MKGRVRILETYPKSEEIINFIPHFRAFADFYTSSDYLEQKCHVLVTRLYNLNLNTYNVSMSTRMKGGTLKMLETN